MTSVDLQPERVVPPPPPPRAAAAGELPTAVRRYLDRFAARRRWQRVARAVGRAVLFTLVWIACWCLLDRFFDLPGAVRAIGLATNVACVLVMIARPVGALFRRPDPVRVALAVERRHPQLGQRLATVTSRALGPAEYRGSPALFAALTADVEAQVGGEDPATLLPWRRPLRPWVSAAILLAALLPLGLVSWLDAPTLLRRYARPLAAVEPVTTTRITVLPGDVELPEGEPLRVRAAVRHLAPDAPPPVLHLRSAAAAGGGPWFEQAMTPLGEGAYVARVAAVPRDAEYFVTAGDARSATAAVTMLPKPAVARFRVGYVYPPYTALPPRQVESQLGDVEAPVGTDVTLTVEATQPLQTAVVTAGGEATRMSPTTRPAVWEAHFPVRDDRTYTVRMAAVGGATGAFRGGTIRAIPDRPPVAVLLPAGAAASAAASAAARAASDAAAGELPRVAADAVVPVAYQAVDDYPLARLDAEVEITDDVGRHRRRSLPLPAGGSRQELGTWPLDLRALGLRGGETIELRLRAEDKAGQFDVSAPLRWAVTEAAGEPGLVAAGAPPLAPAPPPTTRPATAPAAGAAEPPLPLDPPGYQAALRAYFDALRKPSGQVR